MTSCSTTRTLTMTSFDFGLPTRVIFGAGTLQQLGELTRSLGVGRALVVSDPGVVDAGHTSRGIESLRAAQIETRLFDGARENPTTEHVQQGVDVARDFRPDVIVGLGGGSSMDCAKGINFVLTNGGRMQDYWGVGKATKPMLPMVAVPTTAGTGSELQSFALISDAETHAKMACGDKKAACRIALLDPELTLTQPAQVTSLTGIDAVSHALETYVTTRRNSLSLLFSRESWRLLSTSFPRVLQNPADLEARGQMQLGAAYAGLAIENSMLGAAHALANPLTAQYGTSHGQAVGMMLPHVIRFNAEVMEESYRELAVSMEAEVEQVDEPGSEFLADQVAGYVESAGLKLRLQDLGVARDSLPDLAAQAAKQWTGGFNPRPVDAEQLQKIYEQAF